MNHQQCALCAALALGAGLFAATPAHADGIQTPDLIFGILDGDQDGTPEEFSSASLADAVLDRFDERRSFAEFSVMDGAGLTVDAATLSGVIDEQFSFGFGPAPAEIIVELYGGNGLADLSDWDIAAVSLGTITLVDDFDLAPFQYDVTADVQNLLDNGFDFVGVRFRTLTDGMGQADVTDLTLEISYIPAPSMLALFGAGIVLRGRRRRTA